MTTPLNPGRITVSTIQSMDVSGRVVFVGAVHEAEPALEAVKSSDAASLVGVITATDDALRRLSGACDLSKVADGDAPVWAVDNLNAPDSIQTIRALNPDLLVVAGWSRLVGVELLSVPTHGCVGFHASLLPRHRGRAPVNWSIIFGETETGNTMMRLKPGADLGDIIAQRRTPILPEDTCSSVYDRIGVLGAEMLTEQLPLIMSGKATYTPQDPESGNSLPKRTPEMGIINWNATSARIHDWVRAQTRPYPGAFTIHNGGVLRVWRTEFSRAGHSNHGRPGQIIEAGNEAIRVSTGSGSIVITDFTWDQQASESTSGQWLGQGDSFDLPDDATVAWTMGLGSVPPAEATRDG